MRFMDKKEEVLDIELTDYGKYLLSQGKFKPAYYAFYDDNILYDGEFAGIVESQSAIGNRIRNETPQLQVQSKFLENNQKSMEIDLGGVTQLVSILSKDRYVLNKILGTSEIGNQNAPAISLKVLQGEITGTIERVYQPPTLNPLKKPNLLPIPQINMDLTFEIKVATLDAAETESPSPASYLPTSERLTDFMDKELFSRPAADGSYLKVKSDYLLFDLDEKNTNFLRENFEVEVYKIDNESSAEERLIPLTFMRDVTPQMKNGILLDVDDFDGTSYASVFPSVDNVEYYFDIFVDEEIDRRLILNAISLLKSKGLYTDEEFMSDDIFAKLEVADIYGKVVDDSDIIKCD
jgi:hypothetical protein